MDRTLPLVFIILVLLGGAMPARAAEGPALERGAAITDPLALRELDRGRFAVARVMLPERSADIPLTSGQLFALPSMTMVRTALDGEFERYITRHKAGLPNETIGVGTGHDFQLFDRAVLDSGDARFVLAGIVNRMDRAFVSPESCGEVRLIYRLTRTAQAGEDGAPRRLPMTLNIVLKARGGGMIDASGAAITCAEIARRWLDAGELTLTGADLAARLLARDGPLDLVRPENIDRIETNLQIAHAPKSALRDFRTDYLLKVFRFDPVARVFEEAPMENQIDRERLLADAALGRDFKAWLLDPRHLNEFDRGMVLIPERFLARAAIAATPAGFDPSELQPAFGLVQGEGAAGNPVFSESDIVAALRKAADARRDAREHPLGGRLQAPAERCHLFGLSSDARHRRFPFPGRRLDGSQTVECDRRSGVAAFLRRSDPAAGYSQLGEMGQQPGLFARIFRAPAIAHEVGIFGGTQGHRLLRRLGRALLPARREGRRQ